MYNNGDAMQNIALLNKKIAYLNRFMEQLYAQTETLQINNDQTKQENLSKEDNLSFEKILQNKMHFNYPK